MLFVKKHTTQIPLPGGSGRCPSGPMAFEQDWPGLFLRGDDCLDLLATLDAHKAACKQAKVTFPADLDGICEMIRSVVRVDPSRGA